MQTVLFVIYIPCDDEDLDLDDSDDNSNILEEGENKSETSETAKVDHDFAAQKDEPLADNSSVTTSIDSKLSKVRYKLGNHQNSTGSITLITSNVELEEENSLLNKSMRDDGSSIGEDEVTLNLIGSSTDATETHSEECYTIEEILQSVLQSLEITSDVWVKTEDDAYYQVCFLAPNTDVDKILRRLDQYGIGVHVGTSVTVFPASYHSEGDKGITDTQEEPSSKSKDELNSFLKSVKSRLTVAQVVEGVRQNALLTFDYVLFIILASIIAALGLAENSSVILVASMLVSPIMGPIMSGTFGIAIQNHELRSIGVKNELIGLVICVLCGFVCGLITSAFGTSWGSVTSWPTPEMKSRGMVRSLWVGIAIALPSGAGVALSVVGGNAGSLVGVAISASLLPPAVNAGMLWALSLLSGIFPPTVDYSDYHTATVQNTLSTTSATHVLQSTEASNLTTTTTSLPPVRSIDGVCYSSLLDNDYEFVYTCSMATEAALLGCTSLLLTLLNIICIFVMGIIVLRIKEVAPHTAVPGASEVFWKKYVPTAREAYKTFKGSEGSDMAKVAREMVQQWKDDQDKNSDETPQACPDILQQVLHDPTYQFVSQRASINPATLYLSLDDSYLPDPVFTSPASPGTPPDLLSQSWGHPLTVKNRHSTAAPVIRHRGHHNPMERISQYAQQNGKHVKMFLPYARKSHRSVRGFKKQMSCPAQAACQSPPIVKKKSIKAKTSKGRFIVTQASEEML